MTMTSRMASLLPALLAAGIGFALAPQGAQAASACLLEQKPCSDLYLKKNASMLKSLRKTSGRNSSDTMIAQIIYGTFEKLQTEANKGCKKADRVDLAGYKPLFVLGSGKSKRALFVQGKQNCTWVKVK